MRFFRAALLGCAFVGHASLAQADKIVLDEFQSGAETRWEYIADGVMGGVSQGGADFEDDGSQSYVRMTGSVSTENNGGFIQVRRLFPEALPAETKGLVIETKGNGESYYVFIRTREMTRPWYFYNSKFTAGADWSEIQIPLSAFERSHAHLAGEIDPGEVVSVGIVAYGRDHVADISVAELSVYY